METYHRNNQALVQCYFCGEEMAPAHLEIHVKHCGCVLEPCPDNCGLYVQRQYKNHHSSWCKKDPGKQPHWRNIQSELISLKDQLNEEASQRKLQSQEFSEQLEKCNHKLLQTELLNSKLIDAVTGIRKLVNDEQCGRLKDILELKTNASEATKLITQLKFTLNQTRVDVEELRNDHQSSEQCEKMYCQFLEWKNKQEQILSDMRTTLDKSINTEIKKLHKDNVIRSKSVSDLLDLNEVIIDAQDTYSEQIYQLEEDVKEFKKFLAEENIMISGLWRDQLEEINKFKAKFEENEIVIQNIVEEQKLIKEKVENMSKEFKKINSGEGTIKVLERTFSEDLIKELIDDRIIFRERLESLEMLGKSGGQTLSTDTSLSVFDDTIIKQQNEIALRLETLEKLTTEIQKNSNNRNSTSTNNEQSELSVSLNELSSEQAIIKRRLESLENITQELEEVKSKLNTKILSKYDSAVSINGRLMWTISNFNQKLEEAKEAKTQIQSPYFYTSESGYKLQLRAYLNGIGQWEGRHMIISLHVLAARWDKQLTWPCRLKVIICLRDQEHIHRKAKDIVKSFTSSPAAQGYESPCLQMFIPHRTLYTRSYLKNNIVIIDVKAFPI